jgi:hypothetical protein
MSAKLLCRGTIAIAAIFGSLKVAEAADEHPYANEIKQVHFGRPLSPWRRWMNCWCCDDYTGKPLPNVCPAPCGCADDYCAKPLPCASPAACGCCNDYCPKPPIRACWLIPAGYLCVPYGCGPSACR